MAKSYKFICNDQHPDWLKHRFNHVTASETSVLFGCCPWKDRDSLYTEKVSAQSDFKDSRNMWWGRRMEKINMQLFTEISGLRTRSSNAFIESVEEPILAATLDGFVMAPAYPSPPCFHHIASKQPWWEAMVHPLSRAKGLGLIEMKQTESWFAKKWWPQPPTHYILQVQHQLLVSGLDWGLLVAKVGAADMIGHFIGADRALHEEIKTDAREFWKEVESGRREFD